MPLPSALSRLSLWLYPIRSQESSQSRASTSTNIPYQSGHDSTHALGAGASTKRIANVPGWSTDENWVWARIQSQGSESVMPELWQWDFPSFPDNLFSKDKDGVFIDNISTPVTEAVSHFASLVDNGARCRDAMAQRQQPEPRLVTGVESYLEWAYRDGNLQDEQYLDVVVICGAKAGESAHNVAQRASGKMRMLGQEWRERLERRKGSLRAGEAPACPTIFGFVVKYSVVSVLSHDAASAQSPVRTLAQMNHNLEGIDVWHAFTISLVCIQARNRLLQMEAHGIFDKIHKSVEEADA